MTNQSNSEKTEGLNRPEKSAVLYRPDGNVEYIRPKGKYFALEELQAYVEGDIQIVPLFDGLDLICNEEGKIKYLPHNYKATKVWEEFYGETDYMVGNVIVTASDLLDQGEDDDLESDDMDVFGETLTN